VGNFQTLTVAGKNDRMIAHHVTRSNRAKANRVAIARARTTLSPVNRNLG
jgi:hypothetical protein